MASIETIEGLRGVIAGTHEAHVVSLHAAYGVVEFGHVVYRAITEEQDNVVVADLIPTQYGNLDYRYAGTMTPERAAQRLDELQYGQVAVNSLPV